MIQQEKDDPSAKVGSAEREEIDRLVHDVRHGREDSFARLIEIFAPRLQAMIYRMILDWDETRDVAQESFISAYRAISRFEGEGKFQSWLFRIGARKALDMIRRRKRHPEARTACNEAESRLLENRHGNDTSVVQNELVSAIEAAVGALPAEQRAAFVLSEYEGLGHRDIAGIIGVSQKSVEMHLYRARALLREKLKPFFP